MEHRCGTRVPMTISIHLVLPSRTVRARVENVSLSGAFVRVVERIPEQAQLVVECAEQATGLASPWQVPAHVVRETPAGIGVEWCSFAPWAISSLLRRNAGWTTPEGWTETRLGAAG